MGKRSAGFVILRPFGGETRCLLLRCFRHWDFPKGEVEPGEDPIQTARREAAEETGLEDLELRWGDAHIETAPYAGGKVARYYLAESRTGTATLPVNPELGHPEHHEIRWVDLDEAPSLLNERLRAVLAWARQHIDQQASELRKHTQPVGACPPLAEETKAKEATGAKPKRSLSMHEGIPVWYDCCSCEAEPYWVEIRKEMGIEPESDHEDADPPDP